jgi:hypothetical protein
MARVAAHAGSQGSELAGVSEKEARGSRRRRRSPPFDADTAGSPTNPAIAESLTLRPKFRDQWLLLTLILVCGVGGYWKIGDNPWLGWSNIAVGILFAVMLIFNLMPGGAALRITPKGFEANSLFERTSLLWGEVGGFYVYNRTQSNLLVHNVVAWDRNGERDWLHLRYGVPPAALAALLNAWQSRAIRNKGV